MGSCSNVNGFYSADLQDKILSNRTYQSVIPMELIKKIFSYLSLSDFGNSNLVSKDCLYIANEASKDIEFLKSLCEKYIFSAKKWVKYFGKENLKKHEISLEGERTYTIKEYHSFMRVCPFGGEGGKRVGETHYIGFMPKGLTINNIEELVKYPIGGNKTQYSDLWGAIKTQFGDVSIDKPYCIVMLNGVIEESRGKTRDQQIELASEKKGYCAPKLLEAITAIFVRYVISRETAFGSNPWTHTCCEENIINFPKVVVGVIVPDGLRVIPNFDNVHVGVSALRKFC